MSNLYERIEGLCKSRGINISILCRESGAPRGSLTDLKMGRIATLSSQTGQKIADYFGISLDALFGRETEEKTQVTDDDLKFALFGGDGEITDEMFNEVKQFAQFVKQKNKKK